jgi:lipopolysaccharide export system protein LptC
MAAQARAQQLPSNLSGLLSLEGQLQLQRTVQQLQQELQAVTKERDAAAQQLYELVRQADAAAAAVQETEKLKQQQAELQHKVRTYYSY